ncbi:MAG: ABC transporter permease, partial [Candidatus Eremiobacteraeota bacterium]|nr:ABC transporter permease [Candidatus Eremiobacteraeota bacterium]
MPLMDWGRVRFFFSEVGRNFSRNVIMQATAIGTVTVMIVLLGTFLFLQATIGAIGNNVINQIEISAFLSDKAQPADARALARQIRKDPRVKSVAYIPKAEGLRQMRERLRGQIDTSLLTSNPLPDALRVRVIDPEQVHAVAASIRKLTGVANVEYAHDAVERLLKVSIVVGQVGWAFIVLLIFTASIIIANTIRLTVFARRREIAIMQLVGASNTYIRLPFIFEGLIDGLAGALFAIGLLAIGRWQLFPKLLAALPFVPLHEAHLDLLAISFQ